MFTKRMITIGISALIAIFAVGLAVLGSGLATDQAKAQTTNGGTERFIEVTGEGRVMARPDTAIVRFGVETQAESAAAALDENNVQMSAVLSATLEAGVDEENIQTQGFRLQPVYESPAEDGSQAAELVGYRATNVVEVTTNDLDNLGELLDTVVEAGSNRIESIQFEVGDREALLAVAREEAIDNAREKAQQLATLTDAQLGPVRTIIDAGSTPPTPVFIETADVATTVPIAPGTQTIEARVQISWTLE
jgi:uncharacterized protein YggE